MKANHIEAMKLALEALAVKFSEGWHEGINLDASDIMLLNDAAQALAEQPAPVQAPDWLTGKQRLYLAQAWAMLDDYALDQRSKGNDSFANGAEASSHEIKAMLAAPQPAPESGNWYAAAEIDAMVRDLDVAMNGEGAAPQAKLCDLMPTLIKRLTEQPAQQEPLGVLNVFDDAESEFGWSYDISGNFDQHKKLRQLDGAPLYTSPQPAQRTWVGLTDERIFEIANEHQDWDRNLIRVRSFARAIEAAHGIEENT